MSEQIIRNDEDENGLCLITRNLLSFYKDATAQAGMNAHLSKPINTSQLYDTLVKFIG